MEDQTVTAKVKLSREAIKRLLLYAILAWVAFGVVSFFFPPLLRWLAPTFAKSIEPGTFGDMFGAGNAFFSALAFGAVAYTLWLQTQELEEAKHERREARQDSKENIKLQEKIAAMQLKVAQSGDVYAAYARVAGSDFSSRLERLKWLEWRYGSTSDFECMEHARIPFNELNRIMGDAQLRQPPLHYSEMTVREAEIPRGYLAPAAIARRVTDDVQYCLSAIVDLRPALKLGFMEPEEIREVLGLKECRFVLSCAQQALASCHRQLKSGEEIYAMLSSDATGTNDNPSHV
ncbi:MAG: hypothetical protein ACIAS6_02690 [Phycisphaerales bacterium JB060]